MNNHNIFEAVRLQNKDYKLMNWLNFKNHDQKKKLFLAQLDEDTAEILNERSIDFPVDSCKWFVHTHKMVKTKDVKSIELFKVYRFKPLMFKIDSIYLSHGSTEVKTKLTSTDLELADIMGMQAAFKFESHEFENTEMKFYDKCVNIASVQKLMSYTNEGKAKESQKAFNDIFRSFLYMALKPIDIEAEDQGEWYFEQNFF